MSDTSMRESIAGEEKKRKVTEKVKRVEKYVKKYLI